MSTLFPTASELFQVGRRAVTTTPGTKINPATVDVPGSNINLVVGTSAILGQEIVKRGSDAMRGAFIDSARGAQLRRVVFDRTGLQAFPSTPATWDLVLTRAAATAGAGTYDAGSRITAPDGTQYVTNSDVVFGATDLSKTVSVTASISGEAGNLPGTTLLSFVDQPFDATLTISPALDAWGNPSNAAGGTEEESDISLIGRARGFFPTLRRGILAAIEYGALQVDGVAVATATEIVNPSGGYPAAWIRLVIGDNQGAASSSMIQAVLDTLLQFRAGGIPVDVMAGAVTYVPVEWRNLAFIAGYDQQLAESRVRAVCVAIGQYLPPGPENGILFRSTLIAAARTVPGVVIGQDSLIDPLGDVIPSESTQILRIQSEGVRFSNG